MKIKLPKNTKGFTMVELLIYAAGMTILLIVIVALIYTIYNAYRQATIGPRVDRVGISIMDRLAKDIRTGISIDTSASTLDVPTGTLKLNAQIGPNLITKTIALDNGRLKYTETNQNTQDLTPNNMTVSRFLLSAINTPVSNALRYEVEITYEDKNGTRTKSYSGVAILRHSYE